MGLWARTKWFRDFMSLFNGKTRLLQESRTTVYTDACGEGAGAYFNGDWVYANWIADDPSC